MIFSRFQQRHDEHVCVPFISSWRGQMENETFFRTTMGRNHKTVKENVDVADVTGEDKISLFAFPFEASHS